MKYIKKLETEIANIYLNEERIIVIESKDNIEASSNLQSAKDLFSAIKKLCGNKRYPMINRNFSQFGVSKEQRHYYMKLENTPITAVAMIVNTPFEKVIANFFLGVNKLQVPCRIFNNEDDATCWLKQFMD